MNKIVFLTRTNPNISSAYYLRILKLVELFKATFDWETELINFYKPISKIKLIKSTNKDVKDFCNKQDKDIRIIVICGLDPKSIRLIRKHAKNHSIKLYVDIVEMASAREKKLGFLSPSLIMNHRIIKKSVKKDMTVLAISHYFEKYYQAKRIPVVYIPNLYSKTIDNTNVTAPSSERIKFGFIGYPHKKDSLDIITKAMIELYKIRGGNFDFFIAGIDKNSFFDKYKFLQKYRDVIEQFAHFYGVVDRDVIKTIYSSINYSIIMRNPSLVVCQSGFPTKFVESLSYGRPVISNSTSDIADYLKNGYNGFVVNNYSSCSLLETLIKVIDDNEANALICDNAFKSANAFFGIEKFTQPLLTSYEEVAKK